MLRFSQWFCLVGVCCLTVISGAEIKAAQPSETLLPRTTKGYISVQNLDRLQKDFNKTQLGQLLEDPIMKPFADDFRRQLQQKWTKSHHKLGVTWDKGKRALDGINQHQDRGRHT